MKRKIRMGMAGSGPGAFIGDVHRIASQFDGKIELVCGAFDIDPIKSKSMADELFLPEEKCYLNYEGMFEVESRLPEGKLVYSPANWIFPPRIRFLIRLLKVSFCRTKTVTFSSKPLKAPEPDAVARIMCRRSSGFF